MRSKAVIMIYASQIEEAKYFSALYFKKQKTRGLYVSDPTESEKVSASVINRMAIDAVSHKYQAKMRRFFEGHFYQKFIKNLGIENAEFYAGKLKMGKDISDADEYVNQKVVLPSPVLVKPNMAYFIPLFILYLVLCFIQFIVFVSDRWVSERN